MRDEPRAAALALRLPGVLHTLKLDPWRRISVSPFALALRDCITWKTPPRNSPD
jgi:hypothetical protein